jgi:hypothetical protein
MNPSRRPLFVLTSALALGFATPVTVTAADTADAAAWTEEALGLLRDARGERDAARARDLLQRAADAGCARAETILSIAYREGAPRLQLQADAKSADHWLERAATRGYWPAEVALATRITDAQDVSNEDLARSRDLMLAAAARGDAGVQFAVALMYENGEGAFETSAALARTWYERAAVQGFARAQMRLGAHLANGTGGPGDAAQAYFWWLLAAPHDAEARAFAERIRPTLDLAQVADAEQRAQGWQPRRERAPGEGCMALP